MIAFKEKIFIKNTGVQHSFDKNQTTTVFPSQVKSYKGQL